MAETAPLTSAHVHARNAAEQFSKSHRREASEEHRHAATDFSRAGRTTSDSEALRILKLLENQHQKLARILQRDDALSAESSGEAKATTNATGKDAQSAPTAQPKAPESAVKSPASEIASRIGSQARESSPSLARDIASRRGIPLPGRGTPSAAAQARARQVSPESKRNMRSSQTGAAPKIPPSIVDSQANLREAQRAKKAEDDEGFARFYNSLTAGTMSKLSSALAYAGLPLTADEIKTEQPSQKRTVSATHEPDVKKYFSKAALDAVEYQHRQRGTFGHGFGPAESFYVVQTGGGTYSYADITKNRQAHLSGIEEDDEDAFVDASEVPGPSSPKRSRFVQQPKLGAKAKSGKSAEELEMENAALKKNLDSVSARLHSFETHASDYSMASMTQSMMQVRPDQGTDAAMEERLRQLERQIEKQAEERQALEDRSAKQAKMIKKYHSKWEEIKTSAKEKDKARKERAEKGSANDDASIGVPDVS